MTEDEADAKVATRFDEIKATKVETVNGKPYVTDEQTLADLEAEERMREACGMLLTAERRFQKISAHPHVVTDSKINCMWWNALESVYQADKALWRIFVGSQPTPAQNKLYNEFREMLLKGSSLKASA
ncbi:MAG: hypothetical protein ACM37Z_08700 [Deltaproteobacteria bacterium]